jgi:DNA-binding response OmpR family regulator
LPHVDTVLVVDDTPESLRFLADTLEVEGIRVLIATSGEAALSLLDPYRARPDPDGCGHARHRRVRGHTILKRNPASARVPVIFMTGLTESEHVLAALEAGGVDYVRKPWSSTN